MLQQVMITSAITLVLGIVYASFFEWFLHRYVMHRPFGGFRYPFDAHARTHHHLFKADDSYHCTDPALVNKITMAWWNGPLIILFGPLPFYLAAVPFAWMGWTEIAVTIVVTSICISAAYYGKYEYLHYCMHLPKGRWFESTWLFRRLNGHHIIHHRWMGTNFNVVLPLADLVCGTLLARSKIVFKQVRGPSVPDLQPLTA